MADTIPDIRITRNAYTDVYALTGMTWGNSVLVTILLSGTNSLSLTPNTVVRLRVEGIGNWLGVILDTKMFFNVIINLHYF